jgi:hypothetical protein
VNRVGTKYYHTWVVENVETEQILFHYTVANTGAWILVCVGISLIVCGILFIVHFVKNKTKEK